jgi:hypothetical protein
MIKVFIIYASANNGAQQSIYEEFCDYPSALSFLENFVSYNKVLNIVITRG